jgi:hypothetical protein
MVNLNDDWLLMIEPTKPIEDPIDDELSDIAKAVYKSTVDSNIAYRGVHSCICGKWSDNVDHILPDGTKTNSLMVHYIREHRSEVPESEIVKLRSKYDSIRVIG